MSTKIIGVVILVSVIIVGVFLAVRQSGTVAPVTLNGYIGGEKSSFFDDEMIRKLFKERYGLTVDYQKAGSIEMVGMTDPTKIDFLFPSSQTDLELYKQSHGNLAHSDIEFNSPLVIYTWDVVADAFVNIGIAQKQDDHYTIDFAKLVKLIRDGKKWSDVGVSSLYGRITILTTDPTKSNSGNQFAALLATTIAGDVVDEKTLPKVMPEINQWFTRVGYMEHSSSDLFEQYLRTGMGAKPMVVGYESQIIEFAVENPQVWEQVKNRVRILYPVPTVWSAHPIIVVNPKAEILVRALSDKDVQKLAWERHGFRTGVSGNANNPKILKVVGIPERIDAVVPMPAAKVMEELIQGIK